ncbi:immunoglobulin-like domain-containing protein [Alkalihalobacterium alkalinitrilicum]|uniref:immunoglobulin-like domain-containing protein n=1 Tax=Alkalihalobacterium alkalinitrilicum TaxID=427920 RepID=UPI000994F6B6|nr:immunoglobulin-like domain-containing protein [Alkalihalobacterium alkalinitrilicum]
MNRKMFLTLLFTIFILIGCNSQSITLTEKSEYEDVIPSYVEIENFSVEMNATVVTSSTHVEEVLLEINNLGTDNVGFGEYYQIEKRQDDGWYKIPFLDNVAFIDIGYFIHPGVSEEMKILTKNLDYHFPTGQYRIIKDFWTDEGVPYTLAYEFNITME